MNNFDMEELACPHCGYIPANGISNKLLIFLSELQNALGVPLKIYSCVRCGKYNTKMHGHKNSYHILGKAVDIYVPNEYTIEEFTDVCLDYGAERADMQYDKNTVHVQFE